MSKHYPVEQRERAVKLVLDHLASDAPRWLHEWGLSVGSFAVGCLVCWACDVAGRRRDLK